MKPRKKTRIVIAGGGFAGLVAGIPGLWAVGDCAAVSDCAGGFYPPTAQHGMREAVAAARNIARAVVGEPLKPFQYKTIGMLASIGHHSRVAMLFGVKFSGFIAWWMWRSVYVLKLPRLAKKIRVVMDWTLDLFFGRNIEQAITLSDIEATAEQIARVRARRNRTPVPPEPKDSVHSSHNQTTKRFVVFSDSTRIDVLTANVINESKHLCHSINL
jgi:NDH2 C-terminal domain